MPWNDEHVDCAHVQLLIDLTLTGVHGWTIRYGWTSSNACTYFVLILLAQIKVMHRLNDLDICTVLGLPSDALVLFKGVPDIGPGYTRIF